MHPVLEYDGCLLNAKYSVLSLAGLNRPDINLTKDFVDNFTNSPLIKAIGEINPAKFDKVTPGFKIPVISEQKVLNCISDYFITDCYHFRDFLLQLATIRSYVNSSGKIVIPLPFLEVTFNV